MVQLNVAGNCFILQSIKSKKYSRAQRSTEEKKLHFGFLFWFFFTHQSTAMRISAPPTLRSVQHVALFLYYPWEHTFLFSCNQLVFPRITSTATSWIFSPHFSPFPYAARAYQITRCPMPHLFCPFSLFALHAPFLVGSYLSHRDDSTPPPQIAAKNKASAQRLYSPLSRTKTTNVPLSSLSLVHARFLGALKHHVPVLLC
jgi:hypothetical protein